MNLRDTLDKIEGDDDGLYAASLIYQNIYIPSFARDIVLFGKEHGEEILKEYGLGADDLKTIIELPVFKAEVRNLRKLMDEGVFVSTQMRAAAALEGAVDVLSFRMTDPETSTKDVVAVVKELKALAMMTHTCMLRKAEGDQPTSAAGMTINFSFGDPGKLPPIHRPTFDVTPEKPAVAETNSQQVLVDNTGGTIGELFGKNVVEEAEFESV